MSKIEWREAGNQLAAVIDGKVRGTVEFFFLKGQGKPPVWHATAIGEHSDTSTYLTTAEAAKQWVEGELESAVAAAQPWTPAHQALAEAEGWAIFNGDEIQMDDDSDHFTNDEAAYAHVKMLAEQGSRLHQLAISIHDGTPAPAPKDETEEERLERAFQKVRAKWDASGGTVRELCSAIEAGYAANKSGMDDDMLTLLVDLGDQAGAISALAEAAGALLHAFGGDTPEFVRKQAADLENALHGF